MAEPLDPTASWPRHLQESWRDCAERGEVDGHTPATSSVEAYLQVAEARTRRLAGIPWGSEDDDTSWDLVQRLVRCARCGAGELEHFYTSKRDGRTLCATCFTQRVARGLAQEAAARGS